MTVLKGSKTHENLKHAFATESQANRRYLYFARAALADPARPASIVVEHPLYRAEAVIPPAVRDELIADLR